MYPELQEIQTEEMLLTELLRPLVKEGTAEATARRLMIRYGSAYRALCAEEKELCTVEGMVHDSAFYLKLQFNGCMRAMAESQDYFRNDPYRRFSQTVVNLSGGRMAEALYVALLDGNFRLFDCRMIAEGNSASVDIDARTLYRVLAESGRAKGVVLVHNHPSGNSTPSLEDVKATQEIQELLNLVGVKLYDHIVAGRGSTFSFAKAGLLVGQPTGTSAVAGAFDEPHACRQNEYETADGWEQTLHSVLERFEKGKK